MLQRQAHVGQHVGERVVDLVADSGGQRVGAPGAGGRVVGAREPSFGARRRLPHLLVERLEREPAAVRSALAPAQLEERQRLLGQQLEQLLLLAGELAGHVVHHADRAQHVAARRAERRAGIEADERRAGHERVVVEALVVEGVGHHERALVGDHVPTERHVAAGLGQREPVAGLEPLAPRVDQRDERDRRVRHAGCQAGERVEAGLGGCVEDVVRVQRGQARVLLERCRRHDHERRLTAREHEPSPTI